MSYLEVPPKASMLYALEVPPAGGNTSFCTMYGIYEALPTRLKDRIANIKIKHDGTYNSGGYVRQGVTPTDDPLASPGAVHPLVCTPPVPGRRMPISAAVAMPIWSVLNSRNPRRCLTNSGAWWIERNLPGSTFGASAI